MAGELHRLTVRFDADVSAFNAALQSSEQRVKTFTANATTSINNQSKAERDLARHHERIIQLEKEWQAAQAKRNATAAFLKNSEVVNGFQRINDAAGKSNKTLLSGNSAFRQLSSNLTTVAATMLPVNAGFLRLGSTLGLLTLSGGTMVAVLGGLAALSFAWDKVAGSAKKAGEESEKSAKRVAAFMERLRSTDLANIARDIVETEAAQAELIRKLDAEDTARGRAFDMGLPAPGIKNRQERLNEIDETRRALEALRAEEQRLKDLKIEENVEAHTRAERERAAAVRASAKDMSAHVAALTTLVAAGEGTLANEQELRQVRADSIAILRDENQELQDRAAALARVTAATNALTEAQLRQIRSIGLAGVGGPGSKGGPLLPAPRSVEPIIGRTIDMVASGSGIGDIFAQMQQQFTAQLVALPQMMMMNMASQLSSMMGQGLSQLFTTIFFGKQRHGSYDVIKRLEDAAERQMEAAEELKKAAHSIRNVPFTYNAEFARHRIGMTRAATSTGGTSIGQLIIQASPTGDSPASLWRKIESAFYTADREGNTLARSLLHPST